MEPHQVPNVQFVTTSAIQHQPPTIASAYRNHSRFTRIRLVYPGPRRSWHSRLAGRWAPADIPEPDQPYTPARAMQLLANTSELPDSWHDLEIVLTHYRHAIYHLATQALNSRTADPNGQQPCH